VSSTRKGKTENQPVAKTSSRLRRKENYFQVSPRRSLASPKKKGLYIPLTRGVAAPKRGEGGEPRGGGNLVEFEREKRYAPFQQAQMGKEGGKG